MEVIEAGGTFAEAAAAVGIKRWQTLVEWITKANSGEAHYADFADAVARARERRPLAVLRTLADEPDWRAREAYLKQLQYRELARSTRRVRDAEAELMEAKANAAKAMSQQGGAGLLMLAEDLDLPPALAEAVKAHLASRGIGVLPRVDLVGDVSDDDVAGASPTPMGGE